MKKMLIFLIIPLLCACTKSMTCTIDNRLDNYYSNVTYKITYRNNRVLNTKINGKYVSESDELKNYFETFLKTNYSFLKKQYNGYTFDIKKNSNTITYNVNIDYTKIDLKKMAKNGDLDSSYLIGNDLTLDGAKEMYEKIGASCK